MKVKLTTNIGSTDQAKYELPTNKDGHIGKEGDELEVDQKTADLLIKNGWAVSPLAEDAKPAHRPAAKPGEKP